MAPSDSRSLNRCGHGHLACKFPNNVTVPSHRFGTDNKLLADIGGKPLMRLVAKEIAHSGAG
jgi:hypothetical protein